MQEEENQKYNRVIAYIRKSSEDNELGEANKQLNSIEYQREFVKKAILQYNLSLIKPPFEDDKTGYQAFVRNGENGFKAMLDYLEEHPGEVDGIICTEISRLARNFGDGGMILWYLQNGTIKRIYTPTKVFTNSSSDQLMVAIEFAMSKKSSDDTGYRTRAAMKSKSLTMKHPARPAILGYITQGPVGRKEWIIDPKNGPLVKLVFERFATGKYQVKELAKYAYSLGLRSKDKRSESGMISHHTWITHLKDIQYTGVFLVEKERIVGNYESLISSDLFYQIQELFRGNQHPKSLHLDYAYSSLVQCSRCKDKLSGTHKKGITYYRCSKRKLPCRDIPRVPYIPEKELESELTKAFKLIEIDEDAWKKARDYTIELNIPQKEELQKQIKNLDKQAVDEEQMQINLGRRFALLEIDKTTFDRLMQDSYGRQASLRKTIVKCENIVHELTELMYRFLDNIKYITHRFEKTSSLNKRELVSVFCENLVWDYEKLHWDWLNPYFILVKHQKESTVLPRLDSN